MLGDAILIVFCLQFYFVFWTVSSNLGPKPIFDNSRKNNGQAFSGTFAQRLYSSQHLLPGPGPKPDSNCSKFESKTVEV